MPVKSLISPLRAFLYKPLGSRCSQTLMGVSIYTSINSPSSNLALALALSSLKGEINAVETIKPASRKSCAQQIVSYLAEHGFIEKGCIELNKENKESNER